MQCLCIFWGGGRRGAVNKVYCYVAGNFFITVRALVGFFEVTWQLTMKLFPAQICERTTLQNLWRHKGTVHCYPRMLTDDYRYSEVQWISSYIASGNIENSENKFLLPLRPVIRCLSVYCNMKRSISSELQVRIKLTTFRVRDRTFYPLSCRGLYSVQRRNFFWLYTRPAIVHSTK